MNAPATRLDGRPQTGAASSSRKALVRRCLECGESFTTLRTTQDFCGDAHKKAFNNRRAVRGAPLYDLFMALRYDRPLAKALRVMTLMYRLAAEFRAEDVAERGGRPSWRKPGIVLERLPHLHAVATDIRRVRR